MNKFKFKRLWNYAKGYKWMYVAAVICALVSVVLNYTTPLITAWTVDGILNKQPIDAPEFILNAIRAMGGRDFISQNLWVCGLALLIITVLNGLVQFLNGRWTAIASENIAMRMKNSLFTHLQNLTFDYHVKAETGDLIQRCTTDVDTVRRFISGQMLQLVRSIFILIFAVTVLVKINWKLTIIGMILMPFTVVFSYVFSKRIERTFKVVDEADGALSTVIQENLSGVRVVRAFGREKFELEKFHERNETMRQRSLKLQTYFAQFWSSSDVIAIIQQTIVLFGALYFVIEGDLTVGEFLIFNSYVGMMLWPIRSLGRILSDAAKMSIALGRIEEIFIEKEETSGENPVKPSIKGDIVFDHVTFWYEAGKPILNDMSFSVKQGQTVAILGATGSGKSTMMYMLQRLYDYQQGSIKISGVELKRIDKQYLRSRVGIVLQEPFLYSKTIQENIGIVYETPELEPVQKAAKVAAVHDVIESFDKGYETLVGEKGVTLSGGQKQRVAIARTLMKDNDILIFDDSLSAVDTETDMAIRKALKNEREGITTFIISHRISTLSEADLILVLEDGKIVQSGTHEELIAQDGLYQRVWNIQGAAEEDLQRELTDENHEMKGSE